MALSIWRPSLPESNDGEPLAMTLLDLYPNFPVDRLPDSSFLATFLRPESMVGLLLFYIASKPMFKAIQKLCFSGNSPALVAFITIHNFALAVFSLLVALNSWRIVAEHFSTYGLFETYCDPNGTLWNEAGFGAWAFIFYIS